MIPKKTILESDPPIELASAFALREGNSKKPIYAIHKWWARRLGPVFRLLLLGATHSAKRSPWLKNGAFFEKHDLKGIKVFDPFVGGGTSVVEASKCGASVIGVDIDPVAAFVSEKELEAVDEKQLQNAFARVSEVAKDSVLRWYRTTLPDGRKGTIVYAFWVETIRSKETGKVAYAHPHYQLCRDQRNRRQTVFCSHCHAIHKLALRRASFVCVECGGETNIRDGIVNDGKLNAPGFPPNLRLLDLYSEKSPPSYHLFALQVLPDGTEEKVFKKADEADLALFEAAAAEWKTIANHDEIVPSELIPTKHRTDRRPVSYGLTKYRDLFNARQLLCLSKIGAAIKSLENQQCREFLALAFSDCLASNNMLCYYAFDYDKLTPLFGLHAYTKVTRPVENNVWGATLGRGSFEKCFAKLLRGKQYGLTPYESKYCPETDSSERVYTGESIAPRILRVREPLPRKNQTLPTALILNQSSANITEIRSGSIDLILTDPPYYNNLAYSELSDFYHVWLKRLNLMNYNGRTSAHAPMAESLYAGKSSTTKERGVAEFAKGLGAVFQECGRVLVPNGIMVFSYSHNDIDAWLGLGFALARGGLEVTNIFPVRSEGQSQFHSAERNLKWDIVFCCRHAKSSHNPPHIFSHEDYAILAFAEAKAWKKRLKAAKLKFSKADARSLALGIHTRNACNSCASISKKPSFKDWKNAVHPVFVRIHAWAKKL